MEAINYANGSNMTLPTDAQIVQGVSGNAVYLPAGAGTMPIAGNRNELTISLWRQWDGVVEADHYRGVFSTANIKAYFDQATDFLTVELAGVKTVTDVKDDQEQTHWCFLFSKNGFFKVYKNAELKAELTTGNYPVDFSEGFTLGGGRTHAIFDEVRMYKAVVTESEIRGLYRLVTKGTQVKQLENIVAGTTPKYLGVVQTVPDTRTAIITKGERLGAVDANTGDWVLSGRSIGGWKVGVCYRWSGAQWLNLEPEVNYAKEYQSCLVHMFQIEELKQQTGHFGALFAKILVAQKALIDELLVNQAFIKNLVVQKLKIDTDDTTNQDFEAWFDELNGLKIRNKGEEIFRVDTNGDVFAKKAHLQDGFFSGEIISGPLELLSSSPELKTINLNKGEQALSVFNRYKNTTVLCKNANPEFQIVKFETFLSRGIMYEDVYGPGEHPWDPDEIVGQNLIELRFYNVFLYGQHETKKFYTSEVIAVTQLNYSGPYTGGKKVGDIINGPPIDASYVLELRGGSKTFKLKDIPTFEPLEKNVVWVTTDGFLKIVK
ncbi:LamG domain-containing protein [Treponema denticola]|uniref:LamG domain-containing protein n=1 Tax=Treponema denticola TaxID=158 RepID=UPI0020553586|nr:LamG domain-containing protein [Treponema denticola]UTC96073.1 LamG domain-containing protein [Treponema denticola]DAF17976.1 MAG TPA: toxin [Caudoviricetes sp.]